MSILWSGSLIPWTDASRRPRVGAQVYFYNAGTTTPKATYTDSGGRGGTPEGDWSADKTIALPDWRGRIPIAPDSFGNSAAGRITDAVLGENSDLLGAAGGAQTHTLVEGELPEITPSGTVAITDNGHRHFIAANTSVGNTGAPSSSNQVPRGGSDGDNRYDLQSTSTDATVGRTSSDTTGITASFTGDAIGEDTPHNNLQPSIVVPFFIKL